MWRLWLVDADGNEIPPIDVKLDKRPENIIRSEFKNVRANPEGYDLFSDIWKDSKTI